MSWIFDTLEPSMLDRVETEVSRRLLNKVLDQNGVKEDDKELYYIADSLVLAILDKFEEPKDEYRSLCAQAFQVYRILPTPENPIQFAEDILQTACFGVLGDRIVDASQYIQEKGLPNLESINFGSWADRVKITIFEIWLRLIRKDGWHDLDKVQERIITLREYQNEYEEEFLNDVEDKKKRAYQLISLYHLSKIAELIGTYLTQGNIDGKYDIRQGIEAQFDRALQASINAFDPQLETLVKLLSKTADQLIDNSIWTVTRAVNSRVTKFVENLVSRANERPLFELLPPQRKTLREEKLLGSSYRSVVVNLPTSSGKTLIAQFRILQALNQFDQESGWVAYLVPTRALVNQITTRLRRDFSPIGISVEKVSPALEIDDQESHLLTDANEDTQFRVLVTTPEKLDLMLRNSWEEKIGRPLTLVVVDEAHNISNGPRGLRLELLLATINRECRYAQYLLLTPFIENAKEIAQWLDQENYKDIQLTFEWKPNDRAIILSKPNRGKKRGEYSLSLETIHTSKDTLSIPESINIFEGKLLDLTWSQINSNASNLAAVTTQYLKSRGPIIVLAQRPDWTWSLARNFKSTANHKKNIHSDVELVKDFIQAEYGTEFELLELLNYGVAVHHSGLSDEIKRLIEWLFESGKIDVLVATTTIAQGVNFPVTGVVLAHHQYPYAQDMPPADFWNLAGRAGRVDQGRVGIIALAATNEEKAKTLKKFVTRQVLSLNSMLVKMVNEALEDMNLKGLQQSHYLPEWSAFLQYLVHTYRQIGDKQNFALEVEEILRGTFGFKHLRAENRDNADKLVELVRKYAEDLSGRPLKLVDMTGFSLESVESALTSINQEKIDVETWDPKIFSTGDERLRKLMGILLRVPELRSNLEEVLGGETPEGNTLSRMIKDWVNGESIPEMAKKYYMKTGDDSEWTNALTKCSSRLFGKLTQTAAWGLSALQSMSVGDIENLSDEDRATLTNLPSYVYYGVNSKESILLRLLGVPRQAATQLSKEVEGDILKKPLPEIRQWFIESDNKPWVKALGESGETHFRVWKILEGIE